MAYSSVTIQFLSTPAEGQSFNITESLKGLSINPVFNSLKNNFVPSVNTSLIPNYNISTSQFDTSLSSNLKLYFNPLFNLGLSNFLLTDQITSPLNGLGLLYIESKYPNAFFSSINVPSFVKITINNISTPIFTPSLIPPPEKHYFQYLNLNGDLKTRDLFHDPVTKIFTIPEIMEEFFITDVFLNSSRCNYISLLFDNIEMEAYINTSAKSYKPNKYSFIPAYTVFSMQNFTPVTSSTFNITSTALPVSILPKIQDNPDYQFLYALATSTQHNYFDSTVGVVKVYPICSQGFLLTGTKFQPSRKVLFYAGISVIATTCTLNILDTGNTFVPTPAIKNVFQDISNLTSMITGFIAVLEPIV